jgi:FHS family glucose/mannose:H+ symporter-like MFS transporter
MLRRKAQSSGDSLRGAEAAGYLEAINSRDSVAAMALRSRWTLDGFSSAYRGSVETLALHVIFFLTGLGTLVLGPMLPGLSLHWHLDDMRGGLLLGTQFLGAFLGAVTLGRDLGKNLSAGCAAIVIGFGCMVPAAMMPTGFALGVCGFLIAGFGLGRTITSINLIAGGRFARRRGSALSLLNLTWGLGALIGPVVADRTASRLGIPGLFATLTAMTAIVLACCLLLLRRGSAGESTGGGGFASTGDQRGGGDKIVFFAIAFLIYGGIEASLSGWMSSLTARSAGGTLLLGATATSSLWIGMAAGRALAAILLLRIGERTVLTAALALSGVIAVLLRLPGAGGAQLVLLAAGLGASLAPVFPSLCSLLLARTFSVSSIGRVMAVTALGSAGFPWLVGVVSTKTGKLQDGLWVPVALCVILAALVPVIASRASAEGAQC